MHWIKAGAVGFLGSLILHAVYGALNGWLIPRWIGARQGLKAASR